MSALNTRVTTAVATCVAAMGVFWAAALAQTPTVTPASATPSPTGTPTPNVSSTATIAGGVSAGTTPVPTVGVPGTLYRPGGGAFAFANPFTGIGAFERMWTRTDKPVKQGKLNRGWLWGPSPNTPGLLEQYGEDPTGQGHRLVQYFDKSRMEMNNPYGEENSEGYVTNGLLAQELISGYIQVGENSFVKYHPACTAVSGDFGDTAAPTYFALQNVSNTQAGDHKVPNLSGHKIALTIDSRGNTGSDPSKALMPGMEITYFEARTSHNIPKVFWDFLTLAGPVYELKYNEHGHLANESRLTDAPLGYWIRASGLPISEAYWAKARIRGVVRDVLIQAFERRVLTYVPTNPQGFQVEMANIGQHYFDWRYRNSGFCPGDAPGTPGVPSPAQSGVMVAITPTFPAYPTYAPPSASTTPAPGVPIPTGTITPLPIPTTP